MSKKKKMTSYEEILKVITRVAQDYKDFAIVQNAIAEIVDEIRYKNDK